MHDPHDLHLTHMARLGEPQGRLLLVHRNSRTSVGYLASASLTLVLFGLALLYSGGSATALGAVLLAVGVATAAVAAGAERYRVRFH